MIRRSGKFAREPTISIENYKIIKYYVTLAPATAVLQEPTPRIGIDLKGFRSRSSRFHRAIGATTMVQIGDGDIDLALLGSPAR